MFPRNRRGAIFGLDARVALVMFAILSTITGFVLYQRAEEAQDIKLYASIKEIEQALKLAQRDLGVLPGFAMVDGLYGPSDDQFSILCSTNAMLSDFLKRWKGPYITAKTPCNADTYKTYSINYYIAYAPDTGVDSGTPPGNTACTVTGPCYAWIGVAGVPEATFSYINHIIDESCDGCIESGPEDNGRVIYSSDTIWYRSEVKR